MIRKRSFAVVLMLLMLTAAHTPGAYANGYNDTEVVSHEVAQTGSLGIEETEISKEIQDRLREQYDLPQPTPEQPQMTGDFGISISLKDMESLYTLELARWIMIMLTISF